mmetsp:Transcript_10520/g.20313  ORF Transcript_10520/g.20313 Transcript_10520/m.20313 type:complete len:93 (+) Transcript_10520:115-393(+)
MREQIFLYFQVYNDRKIRAEEYGYSGASAVMEIVRKIQHLEKSKKAIDRHINLLHEYNKTKDICQSLLGKIAQMDGTCVKDLYEQYGLQLDD